MLEATSRFQDGDENNFMLSPMLYLMVQHQNLHKQQGMQHHALLTQLSALHSLSPQTSAVVGSAVVHNGQRAGKKLAVSVKKKATPPSLTSCSVDLDVDSLISGTSSEFGGELVHLISDSSEELSDGEIMDDEGGIPDDFAQLFYLEDRCSAGRGVCQSGRYCEYWDQLQMTRKIS